jgi:hypothetical protein
VSAGERHHLGVEPELAALLADEVKDGQDRLAVRAPKPATELLQEQRRALGRSQQQQGVDLGDVQALVEQIDGEDRSRPAVAERPEWRQPAASSGVDPDRATASIRAALKRSAMKCACSIDTQNPSARIWDRFPTFWRSSSITSRTRASWPVYTPLRSESTYPPRRHSTLRRSTLSWIPK